MVDRLIPAPSSMSNASSHLQQVLGLVGDDQRFRDLKAYLRRLARSMLDPKKRMREQNPRKWKLFVQRVCKENRIFNKYEGQWPLVYYMSRHFATSSYRARQEVKHEPKNVVSEVTAGEGDGIDSDVEIVDDVGPSRGGPQRQLDDVVILDSPPQRFSVSCLTAVPRLNSHGGHTTSLEDFLIHLDPKLGVVAMPLRKAGIRDQDALAEMANWPAEQRFMLLRLDAGIDAYHYRLLELVLFGQRK